MKKGNILTSCYFVKKKILIILFLFLLTGKIHALADWTVLVYVQANNNLHQYAEKNFSDMASIGSTDNLNILVEWHQPSRPGAWRYKIDKGKMTFDACIAPESDGNNPQDLVNAMRWAVTKYPAKKYSLVLWDHGIGILDPSWGRYRPWSNQKQLIDPETVKNNPRIQISGITMPAHKTATTFLPSTATDMPINDEFTRGILFNEHSKTYMTNQHLSEALSQIKTSVLGGKKLDLIGMDACLMAMVEVGYQTKNYADILVASEEVELAHGWHYSSFLGLLKNGVLSPMQLAQGIVLTYELYYKDRVQFFTQSAINLNTMDALKQGLDDIVNRTKKCKDANIALGPIVKKSRATSLQFSAASYIDLHSFLTEFHRNLTFLNNNSNALEELKKAVASGMKLVEESVIAHTAGRYMSRAKGLSIYFPTTTNIDASYTKTDFAKESLWTTFLTELSA